MIQAYVKLKGNQYGTLGEFQNLDQLRQMIGEHHEWTAIAGKEKARRLHMTAKSTENPILDIEVMTKNAFELEVDELPEE